MKFLALWFLSGLLSLYLVTQYGNQKPIGTFGVAVIVAFGPLTGLPAIAVMLSRHDTCIIHCGGK